MTEREWLTASDPSTMLDLLTGKASARKLRWLLCGCCRRLWTVMREEMSRTAIEVAERHADAANFLEQYDLYAATSEAVCSEIDPRMHGGNPLNDEELVRQWVIQVIAATVSDLSHSGTAYVSQSLQYAAMSNRPTGGVLAERREEAAQTLLIRDIFGNPFRLVTLDPRWLTEAVVTLATSVYAECAFDRMPILADALEDGGCDNADILNHCRNDGPHVRGCWVVDLLLGKE